RGKECSEEGDISTDINEDDVFTVREMFLASVTSGTEAAHKEQDLGKLVMVQNLEVGRKPQIDALILKIMKANGIMDCNNLVNRGDYDMWKLRIEQYFQVQYYALWDVIENENSFNPVPRTTVNADGTSTSTIPGLVTTEEKAQKKNDVKARSILLAEWNTHVVVWRNKADLDTMSFDDLYNNFKIVEQEVKRTVTTSSSSGSQNMAFLSSPGSTNEIDTANIQVSNVSAPVSTVNTHDNIAKLSDATVYAFLANQPNGSQLVHEDLEQIHKDDLEEIDLKWQLALLSMRARRYFQKTGKKITINGSDTAGYDKTKIVIMEDTSSKAMVTIDEACFDWSYMADDEFPTNMALMAFSDSEV
nr:hypothetical protein [Tanacetum cinerariifolium]